MSPSTPTPAGTRPPGAPWPLGEAAAFLRISKRHLHRLLDAGKARSLRFGRRVLIPDAEVRRLAERGTD